MFANNKAIILNLGRMVEKGFRYVVAGFFFNLGLYFCTAEAQSWAEMRV